MLDYYLAQSNLTEDKSTFRAVVTQSERADAETFLKMAAQTLNVNEATLLQTLAGIGQTMDTLLSQGWGFKIPHIGSYRLGIRGSFESSDASWDSNKHHIEVIGHLDKKHRDAAQSAPKNRLHGISHGPIIDHVTDQYTESTDQYLTPGYSLHLHGAKIKIAGDDPAVGLFFITEDGNEIRSNAKAISRNTERQIDVIIPVLAAGEYHVKITTQYSGNPSKPLSVPRSCMFDRPLIVNA